MSIRSATRAALRSDSRQRHRVCMRVSDNDEVMEQRTEEVEEMLMTKKRRGPKRKPPKLGRMRGETINRFEEEEDDDDDEEELTLKQKLWKVCVSASHTLPACAQQVQYIVHVCAHNCMFMCVARSQGWAGEKGVLLMLNDIATKGLIAMVAAWIFIRFIGPALGLYTVVDPFANLPPPPNI